MTNTILDSIRLTLGAQKFNPSFNLVNINTIIKQPTSMSNGGCTSKGDIVATCLIMVHK
jgi:hypothetical protein